jgi:hypothetical protein
MVLVAVVVFQVIEGMVIVVPVTNDDSRINGALEVLETSKPRSNSAGDDPLEVMSSRNLRDFSEMEV